MRNLVSEQSGQIKVKCLIENTSSVPVQKIQLVTTVYNAEGSELTSRSTIVKIADGEKKTIFQDLRLNNKPNLWSPSGPYLYRVITR
ncbi:MAG: hypothetical protein EOP29_27310, partial [Rhodococcus sp. (in: high G+C Gram-positive bacteria)]